jgi:hypothetical protein
MDVLGIYMGIFGFIAIYMENFKGIFSWNLMGLNGI